MNAQGQTWSIEHTWPWPPWVTLLFLLVAGVYVSLVYVSERGSFRPKELAVKLVCAALRFALIFLLVTMLYGWMLHRHRKYWDDPDAFDIGRFATREGRHRFQYLPFGGGPRTCVGAQFATAEALTILAQWLSEWRFEEAGHLVRPAGMVTLRPAGGLPLRVERRVTA